MHGFVVNTVLRGEVEATKNAVHNYTKKNYVFQRGGRKQEWIGPRLTGIESAEENQVDAGIGRITRKSKYDVSIDTAVEYGQGEERTEKMGLGGVEERDGWDEYIMDV